MLGSYVGSQVAKSSAASLIQRFAKESKDSTVQSAAQICSSFSPTMFGVFADTTENLAAVQKSLANWSNATCLEGDNEDAVWSDADVSIVSAADISVSPLGDGASLEARATCKYTQVKAGDGCYAVAQRCGITQANLVKYNTKAKFCDTLIVDQYVCCSAGTLPDFSPQPNKDGACFVYQVQPDDNCAKIAAAHSTDVKRIESVNDDTWGWAGCASLQPNQKLCLSKGLCRPPLPMPSAAPRSPAR